MFIWIPFGLLLALFRAIVFFTFPRSLYIPIISFTGMEVRVSNDEDDYKNKNSKHLFVCNHRTLLDPVYISSTVGTPMTAVTYNLSKVSEFLSPMKTVRLTRNREDDKRRMVSQLEKGNLVVCPEGTTCREQFLLRFSPLFTEIIDELTPVALDVELDMFYGTTAGGLMCFDPLFFLVNPSPKYHMNFLRKMEMSSRLSSIERENMVHSALGEELGFECTSLTRKDKYFILAGNEGFV